MHTKKKKTPSPKKLPSNAWGRFVLKLRQRRILETLAAFIGGGWLILEFVHWILIDHYHFPEQTLDVTFITLLSALVCTLLWRWFGGDKTKKRFGFELILISCLILVTLFLDVRLLMRMGKEVHRLSPGNRVLQ